MWVRVEVWDVLMVVVVRQWWDERDGISRVYPRSSTVVWGW